MIQFVNIQDFLPILPELILTFTAVLLLLTDLFGFQNGERMTPVVVTIIGICIAILAEIQSFGKNYIGFFNTVVADEYSILFEIIYLVATIITGNIPLDPLVID